MEILEFGDTSKRKVILIHGFQMPYQIWNEYIDHYKDEFHVLVPILHGHYPNHTRDFVSFSEMAKAFESWYITRYGEDVFAVYAMSMGGVLAATLWENGRLKIEKLILDGSPLVPVNRFVGKMMLNFYLNITHKTQKRNEKTLLQAKDIYPEGGFDDFLKVLDAMTDTTIQNCVKGVANYQLPDNLDTRDTRIYYFHGTKFNELISRKSAKFISKHYKNSVIKCFNGKAHCENMLFNPLLMLKELDSILI
jgi:pimeloyl-ACP methyl ester carboxylesterase